jgi:uncharacterized protein
MGKVMNIEDIRRRLSERQDDLARLGVTALRLFGSYARDEARADSDIDLVVAFGRQASFDEFMDLKFLLEDAMGRPVDLITEAAVRPQLKLRIEREAVRVA